jgi:hypothetical protein
VRCNLSRWQLDRFFEGLRNYPDLDGHLFIESEYVRLNIANAIDEIVSDQYFKPFLYFSRHLQAGHSLIGLDLSPGFEVRVIEAVTIGF